MKRGECVATAAATAQGVQSHNGQPLTAYPPEAAFSKPVWPKQA
jgi:hypothetical protein